MCVADLDSLLQRPEHVRHGLPESQDLLANRQVLDQLSSCLESHQLHLHGIVLQATDEESPKRVKMG